MKIILIMKIIIEKLINFEKSRATYYNQNEINGQNLKGKKNNDQLKSNQNGNEIENGKLEINNQNEIMINQGGNNEEGDEEKYIKYQNKDDESEQNEENSNDNKKIIIIIYKFKMKKVRILKTQKKLQMKLP